MGEIVGREGEYFILLSVLVWLIVNVVLSHLYFVIFPYAFTYIHTGLGRASVLLLPGIVG
jgi:hypothetical protein